jgi:glycine cleavage system T protein (aminomethyltransferase)
MQSSSAPELIFRQPLLPTPFHARARSLSQLDSFVAWNGYSTVDVFSTVEHEYFAIRNASTLYDLSPMAKYRIVGVDALAFLNRLLTRDVSKLKVSRVAYAIWCDDAGHLIDDGTLFRLSDSEYWLCAQERQLDWLLDSAVGFDVGVEDVTEQLAGLALQGPTSCAVLRDLRLEGIERLRPFEIGRFRLQQVAVTVSRTGFTGDLGYEIWLQPQDAETVWDHLMTAGRSRGLRPLGSRALNMARIEAGFILPNVEFISAERSLRTGRDRSPFELGLDWLVDFDKGHFTGRRALLAARRAGPRQRLVGLDIEGNKPAHNALVYAARSARRQIGAITSATWSPTCKRNIALALLDAAHSAVGQDVWVEIYLNAELIWERRMRAARVVERPFFAPERRRAIPPADH